MTTSKVILLFVITQLSILAASLPTSMNEDGGEKNIFRTTLTKIRQEEIAHHRRETQLSDTHLRIIEFLIDEATRTRDGDMIQRETERKQVVGDRRLKCILYDANKKKCLRHKMSFLWG